MQFKSFLVTGIEKSLVIIVFVCPCVKVFLSVNTFGFCGGGGFSLVKDTSWICLILKLVTNRKLRHVSRLLRVGKKKTF